MCVYVFKYLKLCTYKVLNHNNTIYICIPSLTSVFISNPLNPDIHYIICAPIEAIDINKSLIYIDDRCPIICP